MNTIRPPRQSTTVSANSSAREAAPFRSIRRERDFGVGYGTSSGYAATNGHRYAQSFAKAYFRCG